MAGKPVPKSAPGPKARPKEFFEARRREFLPLKRYCNEHAISVYRLLLKVCHASGHEGFTSARVQGFGDGRCPVPEWLIPAACAFLDQTIPRVMGAAWVAEFGAKYGIEPAAA